RFLLCDFQIRTDEAVLRGDLSSELAFESLLVIAVRVVDRRAIAQRIRRRCDANGRLLIADLRLTAGAEEPEAVFEEVSAERLFVDVVRLVDRLRLTLERRELGPGRIGQAVAERAGEDVAARFCDRVDYAAGEAPVLR